MDVANISNEVWDLAVFQRVQADDRQLSEQRTCVLTSTALSLQVDPGINCISSLSVAVLDQMFSDLICVFPVLR